MTSPVHLDTPPEEKEQLTFAERQERALAQLQALADLKEDIIEPAADAVKAYRRVGEQVYWFVGDVGAIVERGYGKASVRELAKLSNISVKSVYEYIKMARFYIPEARAEYAAEETLCYSHLRTAMKLKEPRLAHEFLMETAANNYTVEECRIELLKKTGQPVPPVKVYEGVMCLERVSLDGRLTVTVDDISNLHSGKQYTVVMYELSED